MLKLATLSLAIAACVPPGYIPPPATTAATADPAPAQEETPVDNRTPGQIVIDTMTAQGYACTARDSDWECTSAASGWQIYVTYATAPDGTGEQIWLDSWLERAFAKPCDSFSFAMQDLVDSSSGFSASCDDTTKKFRLNTTVLYSADVDVVSMVQGYEAHRMAAGANLRSIHALSRDSARVVAER